MFSHGKYNELVSEITEYASDTDRRDALFFVTIHTHSCISQICSSSVALLVGPPLYKTYFNQKLLEEVKEELFPCSTSFFLLVTKILQTKISNVLTWCK